MRFSMSSAVMATPQQAASCALQQSGTVHHFADARIGQ
jgi:hypothetical protein